MYMGYLITSQWQWSLYLHDNAANKASDKTTAAASGSLITGSVRKDCRKEQRIQGWVAKQTGAASLDLIHLNDYYDVSLKESPI